MKVNPNLLDIAQNLNLWSIGNGYNYDYEYGGNWYDFGILNNSYQPVEANTTYTISYNTTKQQFIKYYDSSKTFISDSGQFTASSKTFTTPSNCAFIKVVCVGRSTGVTIMLNKGSTALSYMPYIQDEGPVLLWENPDSSTSFAGQTLTISNLDNYKYIIITWLSNNYSATNIVKGISKFELDVGTDGGFSFAHFGDDYMSQRPIQYMGANQINIGTNNLVSWSTSGIVIRNDNRRLIPIKIYGTNTL